MFVLFCILKRISGKLNMSKAEGQESTRHEEIGDRGLEESEIATVNPKWCKDLKDGETDGSDISEISLAMRQSIERDFEFLKKCASNIDRELLYSLLLSQINNSRRLETIMGDILGIPNDASLTEYFQSGEDRERDDAQAEKQSAKFLIQIREMFPDVDISFLAHECHSLDSEEDCTRFINTVMLSGVYPKKSPAENARPIPASIAQDNEVVILDDLPCRSVVYSSDEEISSSGIVESRHCHRKRRRTRVMDSFAVAPGPSTSNGFVVEDAKNDPIEVKVGGRSGGSGSTGDFRESDDVLLMSDSKCDQEMKDKIQNLICYPPPCRLPNNSSSNAAKSNAAKSGLEGNVNFNIEPGSTVNADDSSRVSNYKPVQGPKMWVAGGSADDLEVTTTSNLPAEFRDLTQEEDLTSSAEWLAEQTAELIRLFPNTDPSFLRAECAKFHGSLEAMNEFVISKLEKNDMPSRADYEKRQEMEELQNRYTSNFSIEDFLKVIPDPWTYFSNSKRNCAKYKVHSVIFLKTAFRKIYSRVIMNTLMKNNFNLYLSYKELKQKNPAGRIRGRCDSECNLQRPTTINIQFLQEVAFIRNEEKIREFIRTRDVAKQLRFEEAKRTGKLLECQCCYDSEVMVEDIAYCPNDHPFCKSCVIKYVEVEMGQAKSQFPCLAGCGEKYTLTTLQNVLKPELFSKIIQTNQLEEIQAAGIEDLVQCPFCSYATIMPPEVKILPCLNPECQKESCRLCKELSHIPLRCDEVERSEEVKMRTYIENKMTEALVRTCYKCGKGFVKEEGCNKMVCRCGAKMCYVCRKPVTSYSHFNGQGGTEYEKCPLYSTNDELHVDLVQKVAEEAKAQILQANPDKSLKHDPTMVLPERSYDRPMLGINPGAAVAAGLLAIRQLGPVPGRQGS